MNFFSSHYSLRKSRHILQHVYSWYKKKKNSLSPSELSKLESDMEALDDSLINKQRESASETAKRLENFASTNCKKSFFEYSKELIFALVFALVIATLVRQMWFELYEIPTGSMRPTFREQDHLTVTKTAFGINFPLKTDHLYFDPNLVQRSSIVIWSGEGVPLLDTETTYFGIFPSTKRYIKRCMGKPGDTIYFYGGQIYAIDSNGNEISELRNSPWMANLEYVPFLHFEGTIRQASDRSILFRQMFQPAGKVSIMSTGQLYGEVFNGKEWVKDNPIAQAKPHDVVETYSDILGIRNFAMARLLTKEDLKLFPEESKNLEEGVLYLQLHHTPSLNYPKPLITHGNISIPAYSTIIPLQQTHLDAIMNNLYTARFIVKEGQSRSYGEGSRRDGPLFSDVENGTYEFYYGKATKIHLMGIPTEVPLNNPLYSHSPENIQKLFNLGIDMDIAFSPSKNNAHLFPRRYAYFRDGDLFLMGASILKKDEKTLLTFHEREERREAKSTSQAPYIAFKDYGPPLKDNKIDVDFIRTFGFTIPEKSYLVLGDNHAMSSDSRIFGFIPENNLQGAPSLIIWPPGDRLGSPAQKPYPFMNTPRAIIWSVIGVILLVYYIYHRRNLSIRIFRK